MISRGALRELVAGTPVTGAPPTAMAPATAECAAMDRMEALMPFVPEMTAIVPPPVPAM